MVTLQDPDGPFYQQKYDISQSLMGCNYIVDQMEYSIFTHIYLRVIYIYILEYMHILEYTIRIDMTFHMHSRMRI